MLLQSNRKIMGSTDPKQADEGTIRKEFGISIDKNSVHGSDSGDNAKKKENFFSINSYIFFLLLLNKLYILLFEHFF